MCTVIIAQPVAILIGLVNCLFNESFEFLKIFIEPSITKNIAIRNAEMSMAIGSR